MSTVCMWCCNQMAKGPDRDSNMARVACETRVLGIEHVVIMVPAPMVTHVHIKDVNDQGGHVRGMQAYFGNSWMKTMMSMQNRCLLTLTHLLPS